MSGKTGTFVNWLKKGEEMTPFRRMVAMRTGAEFVSIASAAIGSVVLTQQIFPKQYDQMKANISRNWVEPNIGFFEAILDPLPGLDPDEDRAARHKLPKAEQARELTEIVDGVFGHKFVLGLVGQLAAQYALGKAFNLNKGVGQAKGISKWEHAFSMLGDKTVQWGSFGVMNAYAPQTVQRLHGAMEKTFQNIGMSDEQADEWATYVVQIQVPNALGFGASLGFLSHAMRN